MTGNGVTAPMKKQVQNLVRNVAAATVRYCNLEKTVRKKAFILLLFIYFFCFCLLKPAPATVVDEMEVIASDEKRSPFLRFMALWMLFVSAKHENKYSEKCKQYAKEIVSVQKKKKKTQIFERGFFFFFFFIKKIRLDQLQRVMLAMMI